MINVVRLIEAMNNQMKYATKYENTISKNS